MSGPRKRDDAFARVFGTNLARCRERLDVSQEELGFRADLHRTAVGQLERGVRAPRLDTAVKIAAALGVSVEELIVGIDWRPAVLSAGGFAFAESNPAEMRRRFREATSPQPPSQPDREAGQRSPHA